MKPTFYVNRIGAQDKVPTVDTYLTTEIFDDIITRLFGKKVEYDVLWKEERIVGRLIKLETDDKMIYINLSQNGIIRGRDYQIQSIPTALSIFLSEQKFIKKTTQFYFYFLPFSGNNNTSYMKFFYRMMKTAGVKFLNLDYGLKGEIIKPFNSVKDIIRARNENRTSNSGNQSTFITDEGEFYHIYGKTFGANQKETTLLCYAVSAVTDKPVKVFQIIDNGSKKLSDKDIESINDFENLSGKQNITILDDSFEFDNDDSDTVKDNLRNPKFVYNLLDKTGGEKKCALCGCKIDSVIQAAHIYEVNQIRKRDDLTFEQKLALATDIDNGIWLCENHHKLFDRRLINFEEGHLTISNSLNEEDKVFVEEITTITEIEPQYINERMLAFFDMREGVPPRVSL